MTIKSFFPFCLLLLCFHFSKAQWNPLSFEFESALYDLYFFDETTGVVVGDGAIWRTTDGGDSWQSLALTDPTLVGATIKAVHFCPGCTTGYAVGQNTVTEQAVIYQSEDSGLSWSELTAIPNPPTIWQDVFVAASRVLIVGSEGRMIRSLDGGQSWDEPIDFPNTTINSVAYRPGTNQTVYGTNLGVYRGTDTWASLSNGSSNIQDAYFDGGLGYAVGGNKIYRTSSNNSVNYNRAYSTHPALEFQCVVGYANGRMVGSSNGIYYIVSHGTNNWGIQPSTLGYSITAIDYIDSQIAYATTEQGKILKITAGHELTAPVVYFDNPPGACLNGTITFGNVNFKFGHDYSWEINGEAVATTPGLIHTFDSIGTYDIRLTGDNGSNTNSFSTTVLITNPPDTTFAIGVPEPVICKEGVTEVNLSQSEADIVYQLIAPDGSSVGQATGDGNALNITTDWLRDTTALIVSATIPAAACTSTFDDSLLVRVEKVKAIPHVDLWNAGIGEEVLLHHRSEATDQFRWNMTGSASPSLSSEDFEPLTTTFTDIGVQNVQLVATSLAGCADTANVRIQVIDYAAIEDECWSMTNGGETEQYVYPYPGEDYISEIHPTEDGHILVNGIYGETTFDSRYGRNLDTLTTIGGYIAQYDKFGVLKWMIKTFEQQSVLEETPPAIYSLDQDADGNIYFTGRLEKGILYFNDGKRYDATADELFFREGFLAKANPRGGMEWVVPMSNAQGTKLALDSTGNIYVRGLFHHNAWIGGTDGQVDTIVPPNQTDWRSRAYVSKYTPAGVVEWSLYTGDSPSTWPYADDIFDVDPAGNWYVANGYEYNLSLASEDGSSTPLQTANNTRNIYIAKYTTAGNLDWVRYGYSTEPNSYDGITSVNIGPDGRLYLGGAVDFNFSNSPVYFTGGSTTRYELATNSYYLICYSLEGEPIWGVGSAAGQNRVADIAFAENRIHVLGFSDPGPYDATEIWLTGLGGNTYEVGDPEVWQTFLATYGLDGVLYNAIGVNGAEPVFEAPVDVWYLRPSAIAVGADESVYVGGNTWNGGSTLNIEIAGQPLTARGDDCFLARFAADRCGFVEEQVILASLFTPPDVCANDTVFMGYEIETVVPEPDNSFIVELSDTEGNFSEEPDVLMVLEQTDIEGVIIIPLPENLEEGFYSVRLRMTHPAYVGSPLAVPLVGPVPALTTTALEGCPGDLVLLEAREGSRYRWFPEELFPNQNRDNQQLQITGAGAVWVEAEWFGCGSYVDTFYIEPIEVVIPELSFDGTNVFFEYGDFEEVEWYFDDDLVAITEESFFLFQGNGLYRVRVLDVNGCWVWSEGLTITSSTSLAQNAIKVYPNPVVDQLVLEINEAGYQRYRIWQTDGRLMTQQALPKGQQQISIDWSRFVHGMYILEVIGEQRIEVFRIIKQ